MDREMNGLRELVRISHFYGNNKEFVIAGGGNTSYKSDNKIWVKASGIPLAGIDEKGFVCMSRDLLNRISYARYSNDPVKREAEVKKDLEDARIKDHKRPSVETSLHNLFNFPYVVHTHPTVVNAMLCSKRARGKSLELFGNEILFIEYIDPGYTLFKKTEKELNNYKSIFGKEPSVIFLQNHGLIVCGNDFREISMITDNIVDKISSGFVYDIPSTTFLTADPDSEKLVSALMKFISGKNMSLVFRNNLLIQSFVEDANSFINVSKPFTPDNIVYCKSEYLFAMGKIDDIINSIRSFELRTGYYPRIIGLQRTGLISAGDSIQSAQRSLEVFQDMMKIRFLSENFGGPEFLTGKQVEFIDSWEAENYRRKF